MGHRLPCWVGYDPARHAPAQSTHLQGFPNEIEKLRLNLFSGNPRFHCLILIRYSNYSYHTKRQPVVRELYFTMAMAAHPL
jgi:hypothetical protein